MPKTEDGQFELTLGNRQLLSVFFIVVILLSVFFVMGYIVGKNSSPLAETASNSNKTPGKSIVVDSPSGNGGGGTPVPVVESPGSRASDPIRTEPAKPDAVKVETKREPEKKAEKKETKAEVRTDTKAEAKAEAKKEAPKPPPARTSGPSAGQAYLQLAATTKREADVMIDVLKQKGFSATTSEVPGKEGTLRVLVGPIADGGTNKLREDLQKAGFPGNAAIRRTF